MRYLFILTLLLSLYSCQSSNKNIGQDDNYNYKEIEEGFISNGDEGNFSSEELQIIDGSTLDDSLDHLDSNSADV